MANCSTKGSILSRLYEGLPQNTSDDQKRARELYKYFSPPRGPEPIDTVLTAHAQLAAWRLHAERAMVSLIDEETQYFVAESTKTVHLDDAAKYDDPDDAIWAGCVSVPKAGRLCEHTIATPPPLDGGVACFEVLDLSKDVRFNQLSFIAGPPHFRYYAGVPLRTSRGINIGSIYILDSKTRPALAPADKNFLAVMADNVIQHLEMSRDRRDRQRTFRMNECLSAYVDPVSEDVRYRRHYSDHGESTDPDSDAELKRNADGAARTDVIMRAAELLREGLDIELGGGGVLFLDTALATTASTQDIDHTGETEVTRHLKWQKQPQSGQGSSTSAITISPNTQSPNPEMRRKRNGITETLAHTYSSVESPSDQPDFEPFTPQELLKLIRRYPRGRMFTFDKQGHELSDASESESLHNGQSRSKRRQQRSIADAASIRTHFPRAHQVIFTPIWDSTTSRSAACFIYNCSEYRYFSHQLEFLHCITFNNSVDTELLRLANLKASEQKTDFIGSISHELRSPLHGILASCEFLRDTKCTSFQKSLVDTAEGCARTLLDTVNMVLDYSKINAFEKSKTTDNPPVLTDNHPYTFQSDLSAHRNIDLAILTEEVVEGVATGHAYRDPRSRFPHDESEDSVSHDTASNGLASALRCRPNVELVVEITKQDWTYWCEPGSLRRIVMNLVGNSLKYTKAGFVHVKLETQMAKEDAAEFAVLTVRDSGQGISPAYLQDKLFTPFAQESNQAPGIGLGLSLVKSIVNTLGGHIDIESAVGVGTKATVKIPLVRKPASDLKNSGAVELNPLVVTDGLADERNSLRQIENPRNCATIAIYWPEDIETTSIRQEASRLLYESLRGYLSVCSGVSVVQWQKDPLPDAIVVEEPLLETLFRDSPQLSTPGYPTAVLVLCGAGRAKGTDHGYKGNIQSVQYPIGPHKLNRALQHCLDRSQCNLAARSPCGMPADTHNSAIDNITAAAQDLNISNTKEQPTEALTGRTSRTDSFKELTVPVTSSAAVSSAISVSAIAKPTVASTAPVTTTQLGTSNLSSRIVEPSFAATPASPPLANRILLVDDNAINLRLLQVGIQKRGYTSIISVSDGLQAVNTYRALLHSIPSAAPKIVLMDLSMPVMDGFEATRQIRQIEAEYNTDLPSSQALQHSLIIALTGLASITDQKKAYTAGVDSYIMKPVSFAKLTKLLNEWTADRNGTSVWR